MINTLDISMDIYNALYGVVSEHVYDETVGKAIPESIKDFVVYNIGSVKGAYDYDTGSIIKSHVVINCFAKDKANGIKNTAKLKEMIDNLVGVMVSMNGYRFSLSSIQMSSHKIGNYHGQSIIYNIIK